MKIFSSAKKLFKLLSFVADNPEITDALVEMAEKASRDAVLQKLFDETKTRDLDGALLRKLAESAQNGVIITLNMNNATAVFRKEDIFDDMARKRLNDLMREGSGYQTPLNMGGELR